VEASGDTHDGNDLLYGFAGSADCDPAPTPNGITTSMLTIDCVDDLIGRLFPCAVNDGDTEKPGPFDG
jgi:hypothetical protein